MLEKIRATAVPNRSAESILISELQTRILTGFTGSRKFVDSDSGLVFYPSSEVASGVAPPRGARVEGSHLIVNETPKHIKQIKEGLDNHRELGFDQILVETHFLQINQERIKNFGIKWEQVKSESSASGIPPNIFDPWR